MNLYIDIAHLTETLTRIGRTVLDALFPPVPDDVMVLADAVGVTTPPVPPRIPRPRRIDPVSVVERHLHPVADLDVDAPIPYVLTGSQPSSEFDVDIRSLGEAWSDESLEQAMDTLDWGGDGS